MLIPGYRISLGVHATYNLTSEQQNLNPFLILLATQKVSFLKIYARRWKDGHVNKLLTIFYKYRSDQIKY